MKDVDILVVGGGPTGCALAIDLARRGLSVRIIDRSAEEFGGSRAKGIQPRTLELLYDLDAIDEILTGGRDYPKLGIHLGPFTIPLRVLRKHPPRPETPYRTTWMSPQYTTEHALRARLAGLGHSVELARELVELTQSEHAVTATIATAGGAREQIVARYLVGADGAASTVRKQVGIGFSGTTDEADRILIVDAVTEGLSRERWHVWPGWRGRFIGACPLPGNNLFQWMIRLSRDEEPPRDLVEIAQRIRSHTNDRRIELREIRWQSVFRPNIRLADAYRRGRVLLAGDAAHVHTPAGAQGLNTGIQDAYNLGWKLGQVLAGADDRLLDTYELERRPIAAQVLRLSTKKYEGMRKLDLSSFRRGKDVQQLQLTYHGGPLAPIAGERTRALRVGDRAPDGEVVGADGQRVRLFDVYRGPHFTAIAYGARAGDALGRLDWPATGAALKRLVVRDALDLPRIYGLTTDTLLLIRPDGYVGHIATRDMLGTTRAAARAMTPAVEAGANLTQHEAWR
jgi:2-polyprenyl-6-methoxyphenol hydroxylase-like FAD-dependent oxidoreductase